MYLTPTPISSLLGPSLELACVCLGKRKLIKISSRQKPSWPIFSLHQSDQRALYVLGDAKAPIRPVPHKPFQLA